MNRDFIASQTGREFKKSQNRDRITRGVSNPYYPSIALLKTRWGAYEWCLTGTQQQINGGSLTRYRKIRCTLISGTSGTGEVLRTDEIDFGEGLEDPIHTNIFTTATWASGMPTAVPGTASPEPTATVAFGFVGGLEMLVKFELLEPEPLFGENMMAEAYTQFAALAEFQTTIEGNELSIFDRRHWAEGPVTVGDVRGNNIGPLTAGSYIATTATGLRYVINGTGSIVFRNFFSGEITGFQPPGDGSYCGAIKIVNRDFLSVNATPGNSYPAGMAKLGASGMLFGGYGFWIGLTKTLIKRDNARVFFVAQSRSFSSRVGVFCNDNVALTGQVLPPPSSSYMTQQIGKIVSSYAFPPWSIEDASYTPPPLPTCFTAT